MINNSFWQKCPKCGGSGKMFPHQRMIGDQNIDMNKTAFNSLINIAEANGIDYKCPVCNGKMIISTLNGKPPKD